jgi:hypothetical protein
LVAALGFLTFLTIRRRLPAFGAAAAAVAIFVLCNKVYSPTYDVWLVVFFVLLPFRRRLWVSFCAVDLAIYATVYGYFEGFDSAHFTRLALPGLVAIRTAVLLAAIGFAATRPPVVADPSAEERTRVSSFSPDSAPADHAVPSHPFHRRGRRPPAPA